VLFALNHSCEINFMMLNCWVLQKNIDADVCVTQATVQEALQILRGAVMIVYPMGLPPHDPIRLEFENTEDLSGTQVGNQLFIHCIDCVSVICYRLTLFAYYL